MDQRNETCSHNCRECGQDCSERKEGQSLLEAPNSGTHVKKIFGVVSGKGGVGKSLVTALLASTMQKRGYKCAILDADITGPSIPRIFGTGQKALGNALGEILPVETQDGIKIMSVNLLLEHDTDPVVWRGPLIAGMVKQFWTDVYWGDIDYMFVDMPPGTGDVALTVFQSLPVDGMIMVTSPQELVSMIVGKAVKMADMLKIPVVGIVENMAYFECPSCHDKHFIFGDSHVKQLAAEHGIDITAQIPIDARLAAACDKGGIADFNSEWLEELVQHIEL